MTSPPAGWPGRSREDPVAPGRSAPMGDDSPGGMARNGPPIVSRVRSHALAAPTGSPSANADTGNPVAARLRDRRIPRFRIPPLRRSAREERSATARPCASRPSPSSDVFLGHGRAARRPSRPEYRLCRPDATIRRAAEKTSSTRPGVGRSPCRGCRGRQPHAGVWGRALPGSRGAEPPENPVPTRDNRTRYQRREDRAPECSGSGGLGGADPRKARGREGRTPASPPGRAPDPAAPCTKCKPPPTGMN
jgi:hypothetical protein